MGKGKGGRPKNKWLLKKATREQRKSKRQLGAEEKGKEKGGKGGRNLGS